jgi:hypothetical protein
MAACTNRSPRLHQHRLAVGAPTDFDTIDTTQSLIQQVLGKVRLVPLLLALCLAILCTEWTNEARAFEYTFGGGSTSIYVVLPRTGREIIVAGDLTVRRSEDAFDEDAFVATFDRKGKMLWKRTYGTTGDERIRDGVALPTGGLLVAGQKGRPGEFMEGDCWVFQVDKRGTLVWQQVFAHDDDCAFNDLDWNLSQGSVVVSKNGLVVRLDQNGKILWQRHVGVAAVGGELKTVNLLPGGRVLLGGDRPAVTKSGKQVRAVWVYLLDHQGEQPAEQIYATDQGYSFVETSIAKPDGGVLLGGRIGNKALLMRVNAQGKYVSHNFIASTEPGNVKIEVNQLAHHDDGGLLLAGMLKRPDLTAVAFFGAGTPSAEGWAMRFNQDGKMAWESTFGSKELNDFVNAIASLPGGGMVLGGGRGTGGINSIFKGWVFTIDEQGKRLE